MKLPACLIVEVRQISNSILINIFGKDLNQLKNLSGRMAELVASTPGANNVKVIDDPVCRNVIIRIEEEKIKRIGIKIQDIADRIRRMDNDLKIFIYSDNNQNNYLVVKLNEDSFINSDEIKRISISLQNGKKILLSSIGDIKDYSSVLEIRRENNQRTVRIGANLTNGFKLQKVISSASRKIRNFIFCLMVILINSLANQKILNFLSNK